MRAERDIVMGRFKVELELANNDDVVAARLGVLTEDKVRRVKVLGVVDSGTASLVLPTTIGKQLGLPVTGKVKVTYAHRESAKRDKVEGIYLELLGRHSVFDAHLEPKRDTALIGAIVLEALDFLVDSRNERLIPRDPKYVICETE